MTTREVAESSSPLTHLERESEVVSAPAEPAASLVFFPRPPWVPSDGVGGGRRGERWRGLAALCSSSLTTTTPELSIFNAHCQQSRARLGPTLRGAGRRREQRLRGVCAWTRAHYVPPGPLCCPVRDEKRQKRKTENGPRDYLTRVESGFVVHICLSTVRCAVLLHAALRCFLFDPTHHSLGHPPAPPLLRRRPHNKTHFPLHRLS